MKNIKKIALLTIVASTGLILNSCFKNKLELSEIEGTNWNPSLAIPLLNSNLTVYNVLQKIDNNNVYTASDGFVSLIYTGDLNISANDSFVTIPTQSIGYTLDLPTDNPTASANLAVATSGTPITVPEVNSPYGFTINPSSVDLYKINFKTGEIAVNATNNFSHSVSMTITIPDLTNTSGSFTQTITIPANSSSTSTQIFNINGYSLNIGAGDNNIDIKYQATFTSSGSLDGTGTLDVSMSIQNFAYSSVEADFGQRTFNFGEEDVLLKIFEDATGGTFQILNPEVRLDIYNSVGVPFEFDFNNNLIINSTVAGTQEPLAFTSVAEGTLMVNAPVTMSSPSTYTNKTYNSSNVNNIDKLTNSTPKFFTYRPAYKLNPAGGITPANPNFITDTSNIKVHGEVELPMEGYAYNYAVMDTVPFDGINLTQEEVNKVLFKTGTDNSFPIDIRFQLTFMDSLFNPIDSLFTDFSENFIYGADIGSDGRVAKDASGNYITKGLQIKEIEFDKARVAKLENARYILLRAEANSLGASTTTGTNSPRIKLYDDYNINVRLSVKMDLSVTP